MTISKGTDETEIVTYKEGGYTWKGLLVMGPTKATNGAEFVCVDNFVKRIAMSDVIRIEKQSDMVIYKHR